MDRKVYQVKVGNEVKQYEEGTTFAKIAKEYQKQYENEIVLVFEDKKLQELRKGVTKDCTLRFVTTGDSVGNQTYRRAHAFEYKWKRIGVGSGRQSLFRLVFASWDESSRWQGC